MKLTWLIWCPAHFVPTAASISRCDVGRRCRRCAAASRRSNSSVANRHVRNWPSAVRRTRSQSPQNGFVTRRDHADGAAAVEVPPAVGRRRAACRHLLERAHGGDRGDDLVLADDLVALPSGRRRRAA